MVTHLDLFSLWYAHKRLKRTLVLFHLQEFVPGKINADESNVENALLNFIISIDGRWKKYSRNVKAFKSTNQDWLNTSLNIPLNTESEESTKNTVFCCIKTCINIRKSR
jgi:hypothetical protein